MRVLSAVSHLAVWAGVYVAAAVVYAGQVAGLWSVWRREQWLVLAYALVTAAGVYLVDRVKVRDRWLDPADKAAHPERFGFLTTRARGVRGVAAGLLVVSLVLAWMVSAVLVLATIAAAVGVLAYAGVPRRGRARIKDVLFLKNGFVAAGIAGLALVLALASREPSVCEWMRIVDGHWAAPLLAGITLLARVFADAALCDIDDETSDRAHGTDTLPTRLGWERAWNVGMLLRIGAAVALWFLPVGPVHARRAWAVVTVVSTVGLRAWRPRRVRDIVDARFGIEAALVSAAVGLWPELWN